MHPFSIFLSYLLFARHELAWAALVPRYPNYYGGSGTISLLPKPTAPSVIASATAPLQTLTGAPAKPSTIKTPPYSNYTSSTGKPIYPRGGVKPTYISIGTGSGASLLPTGYTPSKPTFSLFNTTTLAPSGPTISPTLSTQNLTTSTTNASTTTSPTPPPNPSTFYLKTTNPTPSYLSVQVDANGQDALQLSPSISSATAFTLNPDGTLQSGGTFAGVYADAEETILLMQAGVLMGGSFVKSVCEMGGEGGLTCMTGENDVFFSCGGVGGGFVEVGTDEVVGEGCEVLGLAVVPI